MDSLIQSTPPTLPVVDFAKWTKSRNSDEQKAVAQDLINACRTVGFVYVVNHGLSQDLVDEAFAMTRKLFALSHEDKMQAPPPDGPEVHRGYSDPGLEKVSQYMGGDDKVGEQLHEIADCKESYEIGSEQNESQPNVWLPESTLPGFRDFTTSFYWRLNAFADPLLRAIATGIGLDPGHLVQFHSGHHNQLRLLHYPPVPAERLERSEMARMGAHIDWGIITIIFQDDCGGLEVEDHQNPGKFIAASPVQGGACIVNVGDLLMRWSNDFLKSTLHRVSLPPLSDRFEGERRMTRARYSIPFFVTTDPDTIIGCLPACTDAKHPPKYESVRQKEYNAMRGKLQY